MPGQLAHMPSKILREYLIKPDLGVGTDPDDSGSWPIYATKEPENKDNLITILDTAGIVKGRTSPDKERDEQYGIMIRIKAATNVGDVKAWALQAVLDDMLDEVVVVDEVSYHIHSFMRTSPIIPLGEEIPNSRRYLFTLNGLMTLRQLS